MSSFRPFVVLLAAPVLATLSPFSRAESPVYEYPQPVTSVISRAAATADAVSARHAGLIAEGEGRPDVPAHLAESRLTRAEVRAEALAARRLGLVADGELAARVATAAEQASLQEAAAQARPTRVVASR